MRIPHRKNFVGQNFRVAIAILSLVTISCSSQTQLSNREVGAVQGAAIGAGAGAVIGSQAKSTGVGAAIGAGAGAATGAMVVDLAEGEASYRKTMERQDKIIEVQEREIEKQGREIEDLKRQDFYNKALENFE